MISASLDWDSQVLEHLNSKLEESPKEFKKAIRNRLLPRVRRFAQSTLRRIPGPVVYPFKFATIRSQKAFFATKGFGKGIPTRRTGQTAKAWEIHLSQVGPSFVGSIVNTKPWSQFVYGPNQTPGHRRTGWQIGNESFVKIQNYADAQALAIWEEYNEVE